MGVYCLLSRKFKYHWYAFFWTNASIWWYDRRGGFPHSTPARQKLKFIAPTFAMPAISVVRCGVMSYRVCAVMVTLTARRRPICSQSAAIWSFHTTRRGHQFSTLKATVMPPRPELSYNERSLFSGFRNDSDNFPSIYISRPENKRTKDD